MKINNLGSWMQTRNVLVETLGFHSDALEATAFSSEPGTDYQTIQVGRNRALNNISIHAVYALKSIDETIDQSGLIEGIKAAAGDAKKQADKIKNATKTVEKLIELVDEGTEIVTLFGNLATV